MNTSLDHNAVQNQWWIQNFPEGCANPGGGRQNIIWSIFPSQPLEPPVSNLKQGFGFKKAYGFILNDLSYSVRTKIYCFMTMLCSKYSKIIKVKLCVMITLCPTFKVNCIHENHYS